MDRFYESKYCDVQCSILLWPFSSLTNGRGYKSWVVGMGVGVRVGNITD